MFKKNKLKFIRYSTDFILNIDNINCFRIDSLDKKKINIIFNDGTKFDSTFEDQVTCSMALNDLWEAINAS